MEHLGLASSEVVQAACDIGKNFAAYYFAILFVFSFCGLQKAAGLFRLAGSDFCICVPSSCRSPEQQLAPALPGGACATLPC